jgi:hypothetical protein
MLMHAVRLDLIFVCVTNPFSLKSRSLKNKDIPVKYSVVHTKQTNKLHSGKGYHIHFSSERGYCYVKNSVVYEGIMLQTGRSRVR